MKHSPGEALPRPSQDCRFEGEFRSVARIMKTGELYKGLNTAIREFIQPEICVPEVVYTEKRGT
jgi:hypothetical protein